jgi:CheY-like chemotaxis protein
MATRQASTAAIPVERAGLRVLIVEDYYEAAETMAKVLRKYGHDVEIAKDGSLAIEKVRAGEPDVVLLDIGLPGMDGFQVAKRLTGHRPGRTPLVIAVTGYGSEEDFQRSKEAGIDLHLLKPVDPTKLQDLLKRFQQLLN